MNILFRVDSSSSIGLGHLTRCLVLANQYKQDHVIFFAVQDLKGGSYQRVIDQKYQVILLKGNSINELAGYIEQLKIDMVIFDHYDINDQFEKAIKKRTHTTILSFDDTYQKHYCDILLNHNIYAKADHYQGLVPDFCELRCGKKYTLIGDDFKKVKSKNRAINKECPKFFVSLGGVDTANISLTVLNILSKLDSVSICLATTSANENVDQLQTFAKQYTFINICINCNIAKLMNSSDFAIITPSVTTYEAMHLNLPFIAIQTADNQQYVAEYLMDNDFLVTNVRAIDKLGSLIQELLER